MSDRSSASNSVGGVPAWLAPLCMLIAVYDLVLGAAFVFFYKPIFAWAGLNGPDHRAYLEVPGAFVFVLGIAFALIARSPRRNRDLLLVGILFKLAFAGVVLSHKIFGSIPMLWVPFGALDGLTACVLAWAWKKMPRA